MFHSLLSYICNHSLTSSRSLAKKRFLRIIIFFLNFEVYTMPARNENTTAETAIMEEFWYTTALIFH